MRTRIAVSVAKASEIGEERRLTIEGSPLAFIRTGGRRCAVLLIHGNSACKEIFEHQISFLANRGHDVVAPDLPGHGSSGNASEPRSTYSFPGYARTLRVLMQTLGISSFHVVGWSLGGHIGIEMWVGDETVRSLLITGTPPVRLSAAGASEGFRPSPVMDLAGKAAFSQADVRDYASAMLGAPVDPKSWFGRRVARTDGEARRLMLENGLAGVGHDQVDAVSDCPRPLAIVQGKNDPFVDLTHIRSLTYRNLWLKNPIIISGGHAPHWMCPNEFNSCLGGFITE
ncbi:alpha/beta hydrolase [Bradyrhizobium sp. CB1717]|uniref:alpha/beta fold hydrolase n=1 Tax=Bradyrhizobium sp. CB1717 TaxID=3039154 RepID=UPI0024B2195E|nr:alpha/beta hydrolase [Bradyrhizobium sp. CB1717]WFU26753.1 alpha/beta hydrolase [Bradyrhizobium sp. CB1717]